MTVEARARPTTVTTGTTASDLMTFIDQQQKKGYMKANTAHSLKAAAKKVLSIDGDLDHIDVSKVDVDELFRRFANLPAGDGLKQESKIAYRQRVGQAISWFLGYKADPVGWRPPATTPRPTGNGHVKNKPTPTPRHTPPADQTPPLPTPPTIEGKWRVIDFPFPLRDGLIAHLLLPADLKRAEVRRLNAYMTTLAADAEEGQ
ncbi:MAG: hypothetical protein M3003_17165 [Candidatus Dormibacteraeota bacterium]|nr:hypothetical protein [Candidatus Dormibacteraeota bacterium]